MWTNEIDFDESITTVMDDSGKYEDVQIFIDENEVYIRQFNEATYRYELIMMSPKMFKEMITALDYPEGMYHTIFKYKEFEEKT